MSSWVSRYRDGEHTIVWEELRRLGDDQRQRAEVDEVARMTMRRAVPQLNRIVDGFVRLGLESLSEDVPIRREPPADVLDRLAGIETVLGPIPSALRACLSEVGSIWLAGNVPALGLTFAGTVPPSMPPGSDFPDPLCIAGVEYLEWSLEEWQSEPTDERAAVLDFEFAPDELHKAGISGATHDIRLPSLAADPILTGVYGRPGITLVDYLRISVAWGGLPGYSFRDQGRPAALHELREIPDF
jgi:hypothetical protein